MIEILRRIPASAITEEEAIDRDLAVHFLGLRAFELTELRMHEKASFAAREIGESLFFLFTRSHPSLNQRLQSITARLKETPRFLDGSRKLIKTPFRLWNEVQHETGERLPRLFEDIIELGRAQSADGKALRKLADAAKDASAAIREHNEWLKEEVIPSATDEYAIGPSLYRRYLLLKDFGVSAEENLRIAELHLENVNRRKIEVSAKIVKSGSPIDALKKMRSNHHSSSKEILDEYRDSILKARDFIKERKLATIPAGEELDVMETPYFMRHLLAYAAQFEPGKFDGDMKGVFLVTPEDGNPALLEEHSHPAIVNTSVHEGYPGHHLHGVCSNTHKSFIRPLFQSPDFAEGWALYCEDMMLAQGYNNNPMGRLTIMNDLALRITRQICDVKLSMNTMSVEEAAQLIAAQTQTNISAAMTEAKSIMLSPTYFSAYFIGKLGVMQMREDVQRVLGSMFNLGFFHDSLIYSGCMPMSFMRRALALRIRQRYGLELSKQRESLYEYSLRTLLKKAF